MAERQPVTITVFCGTFESQPLVFAHLYDVATALDAEIDLDAVEVICKIDPTRRLAHYFTPEMVNEITDEMGLDTALVLMFPEAMSSRLEASARLRALGDFKGTRLRA